MRLAVFSMLAVAASASQAALLPDPAGSTFSTGSASDFSKSNQSKVFYHDGKWWALALLDENSDWYLWQFDAGAGVWNAMVLVHSSSSRRPDVVLEGANNRLYVFLSSSSKSEMHRFSYGSGAWTPDSGFPVELSDFIDSGTTNPISLVRARNGDLWVFRMESNRLEAQKSSNNGSTWSSTIIIKTGLTTATGTTDGVAFTNAASENCTGVAYAETNVAGSRFGFLVHRDGDANNVWTDETSSLTFSAGERATDELSVTVDSGNNVYVLTENANASGSAPRNTLYKRSSAGSWQSFAVNTSATWTNPAAAVDAGNNVLYVLGINTDSGVGEYKSCASGQEASLASASVTTLFATGAETDDFADLSVPAPTNLGSAPALMVCVDNKDAEDIWYNQIAFGGGGSTPLTVSNVTVTPNEANTNAAYAIPITLGSTGALTAGSGTIAIQFPDNTFVPASISASTVTLNGAAAFAVSANSATREVTITTPVNLANGENVAIALNAAAGLLNPSSAGSKTLSVRTSVEPTPIASPNFSISAATTSVSAATVTPVPNLANTAAAYTLAFNLGAHGRLIAGSSTITITFNNSTTVSNGSLGGAQINGANANATGNSAAKTIALTIPASLNLGNSAAVTINLPSSAVTNPATGGNYSLTVATSVETAPTTSNLYTISQGTPLTVGTVSVSGNEANANASYTIPLTLGSGGALSAGSGAITIKFPNNTFVPGSISASQVTVNGVAANNVVSNSTTREVVVTVPNNLNGGANVSLVFNAAAGLLNPSIAGNYSLQAWSSAEPAHIASPLYAINAATTTVTPANVTPNPNTVSSAAAYDIAFNLGARGRLLAGSSTITITFNNSTGVSNGSISGAQVNGANAVATGNSGSKIVTLTIPASLTLNNNAAVAVNLPSTALTNPANGGFYTLIVTTSIEAANVISQVYAIAGDEPPPPGDALPISGTGGDYDKPHQSRVFYHDGKWWLTALKKSDNTWKLWKFDGTNWIEQLQIAAASASRPDCFVDNANNKLYIFVSHNSQSTFLRLSYNAGAWSMDGGYPANVPGFTHSGEYSVSFSRAKNGELWAFRAPGTQLEGIVSSNEGQSWSSVITVKSGTNNESLTDCHAFSPSGSDYMGVCYSENSTGNSIVGFLRHQDGASQSTWTDETSQLPPYGGTQSDDHINMAVANDGTVYLITKTDGGGNTTIDNGLYKRSTGGTWQLFAVNRGGGWTRPALGIDQSSNQIYAFGTPEGTDKLGYFKKVALGSESQLENAAQFTVFQGGSNSFVNLSVAQNNHTTASGLMVTVEDDVNEQVWYNHLTLGSGGGSSPTPLVVNSVVPNPNTAISNAAYTIGLTLGSQGSLTGNSGTITVTWPNGTTIPASISTTAITVNGSTASAVTPNPANRRAVVTVPNNLANSASVTLAFSASAGLLNPNAGNYTLQVHTSTQPADINSPTYTIADPPPNGSLTVGNITITPDTVNRTASYTIPITLGGSGALTGGSGTITVNLPFNTKVPANVSTAQVTINGSAALNVTTTPAARQAVMTVPNNLANSANVTVIFSSGAGLINPSTDGDYALHVQTSAEPANVNSPNYNIKAAAPPSNPYGASVAANTDDKLEKPNQSKLFYFQNRWWLIAFDSVKKDWYLWKYASGEWTRGLKVDGRSAVRVDAVLDSANSRLYYVSSHSTTTKVGRLLYSGTGWAQEMALVNVAGFGHANSVNAVSIARAANGQLWLFRINGAALEARVSTNNGQTWSATLILKSGITGNGGNTDGLAFTANGNRTGVFYGMSSGNGGVEYGFLHHLDGDANTAWTDETAGLTFFQNERGNNLINALAAKDGRLFFVTKNSKVGAANAAQNTLYLRTSAGVWSKYKVNVGNAWKSPILALDETNDRLYVAGIHTTAPNFAEYKSCSFGNESTLETQTATLLLQHNNDSFGELTAPSHVVYDIDDLMICGGNTTTNELWYKQIELSMAKLAGSNQPELKMAAEDGPEVGAYPNPFNPATTIRFRMKEANNVRLRIFSIRGELLRTLVDQDMSAGVHERRWNGKDRNGQIVASGVYFYRLEIGGRIHQGRLQMVK